MEKLEFINKMWIPNRVRIWERFLQTLLIVYIVLQIFVYVMDGIDLRSLVLLILVVYAFFWYRKYLSRKGKYVEQFCVLRFGPGKLEWEYPHMCIEGTSRKIYVIYTILSQDIQEIALSHEMRSVKIDSKPVMVTVERGKEKTTDFRKQNKKCTLILYYDKIEEIKRLIEKYLSKDINIYD